VIISKRTAPTLQRSALASYFLYERISGPIYRGDPHNVSARLVDGKMRANPKSATFNRGKFENPMPSSLSSLSLDGTNSKF
jgi:hypothetical protein